MAYNKKRNVNMKINLAKSAGFCFGVKRAINLAYKTAKTQDNVYILGDIVHNEDVVKEIISAGIKKTGKLTRGKGRTIIIRAHGAPKKTFEKALSLGYNIIDTTCTMVKEIHKIAEEMEDNGYKIIVIGDRDHDEVKGIVGHLRNKALIIDNPGKIPFSKLNKSNRFCVVVQSTQNIENVNKIVGLLRKKIKNLKFFNTICKPTTFKQKEITELPLKNDVMIIIGSKTSANTKRLYEISRSLNRRSYWIQSRSEINPSWFRNAKSVGVTSGASTPDAATDSVIAYLRSIE